MKNHLGPLLLLGLILFALPAYAGSPPVDDTPFIRTPPAPATPRINGPSIFGAQPGHPVFYHVPVTGQRPITITATGLPAGLTLDSATGNITGAVTQAGESAVTLTATNALGKNTTSFKIVIGPTICLTPPMGWNSWNNFGPRIDDGKIRAAADAMVSSGLIDHGWTYINMDDNWQGERDAQGTIHPNAKFPDMKALTDYIHGKGLKAGIYSGPGPYSCEGAEASYQHEDQDAATYAAWGEDYLKYDMCSYSLMTQLEISRLCAPLLSPDDEKALMLATARQIAVHELLSRLAHPSPTGKYQRQPDEIKAAMDEMTGWTKEQLNAAKISNEDQHDALYKKARRFNSDNHKGIDLENEVARQPWVTMRASLDKVNRDIVYSISGAYKIWEWGQPEPGANLWRTTDDIRATWQKVELNGFSQNGLEKYAGPGHWNDPDMLEVGRGGLTPDENYTHMTLWCMLAAPLFIGCDMTQMSRFALSLFSNDEVLAVDQDALGKQGWRAKQDGQKEVWMKPLADGSVAVAFFNRGEAPADVAIQWSDLSLNGPQTVRDLWRQKDMGAQATGYSVQVAKHGAELFKVAPVK